MLMPKLLHKKLRLLVQSRIDNYGVGTPNAIMKPAIFQLAENGRRGQDLFWKVKIHEAIGHIKKIG